METARRILVPFDSTGPSKRACDYALELSAPLGAALLLVYVVERFDIPLSPAEHTSLVSGSKRELERAARLVRPHVREVETVVVEGEPWRQIEVAAGERRADLIVMGTHGHRGIARALLGSVASQVVRRSSVPVVTVPGYVAISRNAAGMRLAAALEKLALETPNVVALSRGALTVATSLADRTQGTLDLWAVEQVLASDGTLIGAIGEDEAVLLDGAGLVSQSERDDAVASARARLRSELFALKGARSIGECWRRDIVLVADGLFDLASARVALDAIRKLGPNKIVVCSPIVSRDVFAQLEGQVDAVVGLERATVVDVCAYRDDVLPSDVVANELLLAPRSSRGVS